MAVLKSAVLFLFLMTIPGALAQQVEQAVTGWKMQDVLKVSASPAEISGVKFKPEGWYMATVPGTVLTTLVDNKVYPDPLFGENMRSIPESLNKTSYWYRTSFAVPKAYRGKHLWLHFAGINYSAEIWLNGIKVGTMRGAFIRGAFDITRNVRPGRQAVLAVLVSPQPHPGVPHEHTVADGVGQNGGETAIDGPTFLPTIGWDWLAAVRDRDAGIWLPVTLSATGPVVVKDPFVTSDLAKTNDSADLAVTATLKNESASPVGGTLVGTITGQSAPITFSKPVEIAANESLEVSLDKQTVASLHVGNPQLWWPNGYGPQNLSTLKLEFRVGTEISDVQTVQFGVRRIDYQVADSENLTLSVNGVKIMARGGNWGLDEAMKRIPRERLEAQFHMHALANLNLIRNWVGQSTSPDFYDLADKYGILLWDEFFQPNPFDGPNPTDVDTYLANVRDKVLRYRNHPAIAVWCARNEGYPPKALDDTLKGMMAKLDPTRLYQSNSADGRGVSSHGPYYWRSPRFFYQITESFKTETGSVSVPTIESIQGMMPKKDWETINDDWAQHDMAKGAQRGDEYPATLAKRYGAIRNLADFARKAQLANYEAFRAMYEGRNAEMFKNTTGVITWMSHPAQPSFVWQLYHYDLEPNASLYGAKKAAETVHVQLNEANGGIEVVNNSPNELTALRVHTTIYGFDSKVDSSKDYDVARVPGSSTVKVAQIDVSARISPIYFVKLDLIGGGGQLISTNFYWQNVAQDDFTELGKLPTAAIEVTAEPKVEGEKTLLTVTLKNPTGTIALMTHLQLHQNGSGKRVLPVFYSDNYITLVPGESRVVTIEAATKDLAENVPEVLVDGFNVDVRPVAGPVVVGLNLNAQPMHWPVSGLVPPGPPPPLLSHELHSDRSVTFRYRDVSASRVELNLDGFEKPIPLAREKSGVWSFTTQPLAPEIYFYSFLVDGDPRIDPENHRVVSNLAFPAGNVLLVPGATPQPWEETSVPHGVIHEHRFTSKIALGLPVNEEKVVVYTPPGYDPRAAKPYPVLYLLHGWSGVAESWANDQQANVILDNLLAEGKIKPMVVVMPLGYGDMGFVENGFSIWNNPTAVDHNTQLFMKLFTDEIMPFAEGAYNISRDREGRAIAGLSMGGLESLDIGLHQTAKFAWIGGFSSAVHNLDYEHQLAELDPKTANLKLLWIACGTEDSLIEANRKMVAFLKTKGMAVTEIETPGLHVSQVWRDNLIHFAPLLFQN
jgi:beta-mannosidase